MTAIKSPSRRRFIKSSGIFSAASLLRIGMPSVVAMAEAACTSKQETATFKTLNSFEAADIAAIAARIMPTTDTAGSNEVGVVYFFDRALSEEMHDLLPAIRSGLTDLSTNVSKAHPDHGRFSELSDKDQDKALSNIEDSGFFQLTRVLTLFGFFAMSRYGGNKDNIAWDLIGFEGDHGAWQAPFGFYDAESAKEQADG